MLQKSVDGAKFDSANVTLGIGEGLGDSSKRPLCQRGQFILDDDPTCRLGDYFMSEDIESTPFAIGFKSRLASE